MDLVQDTINADTLKQALKKHFQFDDFRPGQEEAIATLFANGSLLCVQPTGYGKSLLYQLPAVILSGITLVISPLLALMRDQVQQLTQRFHIAAASVNTDQSEQENAQAILQAKMQQLKILFIAPERLDQLHFVQFLQSLPIELIVIDEAHCISTWGHDFRPSYRQILPFIKDITTQRPDIKLLALTATANQQTAEDIQQQLQWQKQRKVAVIRHSMNRPNIQLQTIRCHSLADKLMALLKTLQDCQGHGLIYCSTRDNTELVADFLQTEGVCAAAYHAGLASEDKHNLQQQFLRNQFKVIVATNALGMGIDKQDLRFIIHFDVPGSITAYYQEVGRCGRDGQPAKGILLYFTGDRRVQYYFIQSAVPDAKDFTLIEQTIDQHPQEAHLSFIKRQTGLHATRVNVVLAELLEQGRVEKYLQNRRQMYRILSSSKSFSLERYERQYQVKSQELKLMLQYAEQNQHCLMATLRRRLGEKNVEVCGHCSLCLRTSPEILNQSPVQQSRVTLWLNQRTVAIKSAKTNNISQGLALLSSVQRSPLFMEFMQQRAKPEAAVNQALKTSLLAQLALLQKHYQFKAIMMLPSRTWQQRMAVADWLAEQLQLPCFTDFLRWQQVPAARQGELSNNEQRRHNVSQHMGIDHQQNLPNGDILLFDDYTGSGATIKEAARALRKQALFVGNIVPCTFVSVQWRVGRAGMV